MKLLKVFEKIYHFLSGSKNLLYENKILEPLKLDVPVVSVGNLSFGGVGKTPCIVMLASELSKNQRVAIVAKSYKATSTKPHLIQSNETNLTMQYGDEACLLKSLLPQCEVWSGPEKASTARSAAQSKPDVILVDDGFSHRKLARNFDLVLVDATEGFENYQRETKDNLRRAHAVLITKANLVSSAELNKVIEQAIKIAPQLKSNIFVSTVKTELKCEKGDSLFVFCGIGRPETFFSDLQKQGFNILHREVFPDHYSYQEKDQKRIYAKYLDFKNQDRFVKLVTTEKDFIKLTDGDLRTACIRVAHSLQMEHEMKGVLIEKIRKSF